MPLAASRAKARRSVALVDAGVVARGQVTGDGFPWDKDRVPRLLRFRWVTRLGRGLLSSASPSWRLRPAVGVRFAPPPPFNQAPHPLRGCCAPSGRGRLRGETRGGAGLGAACSVGVSRWGRCLSSSRTSVAFGAAFAERGATGQKRPAPPGRSRCPCRRSGWRRRRAMPRRRARRVLGSGSPGSRRRAASRRCRPSTAGRCPRR